MAEIRYYVSSGLRPHLYLRVADPRKPLVCAPRTAQKHICGVLRPLHPGSLFFARAKKRDEKKARPDGALTCAPRLWDPALSQRNIPCRVGQSRTSLCAIPSGRLPKAWRCSGAPYGSEKTTVPWFEVGCSTPRSARRVPQPHRELSSETVFEPEARSLRPASWSSARWGEERKEFSRAPGGHFFW